MKTAKVLLITILGIILLAPSIQAQQFSAKSYKLTINGTSSLHDWESNVEKLTCTGSAVLTGDLLTDLNNVVVTIPVKAIKSTKGKTMDNKTWEAFDFEKNANIVFKLTDEKINSEKNTIAVTGALTMAGITKPIDLILTYKTLSNGDLQINGSKKLKMTDYKMDPPTAMMGTIKVGDDVEVSFELLLNLNNNTL